MTSYRFVQITNVILSKKVASALVDVPLPFVYNIKPNEDLANITIRGDGQVLKDSTVQGISFLLESSAWNDAALALLYKPAVSTGIPATFTMGQGFGDPTDGSTLVQMRANFVTKEVDGSVVSVKQLFVPRLKTMWKQPLQDLPNVLSGDAKGMTAELTALKGNLDLLGVLVGGMTPNDYFVIYT